jgi:hypothetical protein
MADLASQLADLQADFQRTADQHPWLCLGVPPMGGEFGLPQVGELDGMPLLQLGFPGVRTPEDRRLRCVVDHVEALTAQADRLLMTALEGPHRIPADWVQYIREGHQQGYGYYGWVRWLWFAVPVQHVHRFENYAQVAATALRVLRDWCQPQSSHQRLRFDQDTYTVTLDGDTFKVNNPKAFLVLRTVAEAGGPITRAALRGKVRGINGNKAVNTMRKSLPPPLAEILKSGPDGFRIELPALKRKAPP